MKTFKDVEVGQYFRLKDNPKARRPIYRANEKYEKTNDSYGSMKGRAYLVDDDKNRLSEESFCFHHEEEVEII